MKVPLIVKSVVDEYDRQLLEVWKNGKSNMVAPPYLPYFYSKISLGFSNETVSPAYSERVVKKVLSTLEEVKLWKYSFINEKRLAKMIRNTLNSATMDIHRKVYSSFCEGGVDFRERLIIDNPRFFEQYAHTEPLKTFFFDIETLTKNGQDLKLITSIAWASQNREIKSNQSFLDNVFLRGDDKENFDTGIELALIDEKRILEWFINCVVSEDPDIMVGYYMRDFDLVRIFERCQVHGIDYNVIGRNGVVDWHESYYKGKTTIKMEIGGRILYDILDSVRGDQKLSGIKNKKMKTVAEWFGIPTIVENTASTCDIKLEDLKAYNESDIFITYSLFDIYFQNNLTLAEMHGIPLNMLLEGSSSTLATISHAQGLNESNIVSDGTNAHRHPEIFNGPGTNYEAAYVDIYKTGRFEKTYKVDFKGLYNAIEITVNASPDTTKIVGFVPYDLRGFGFRIKDDKIRYSIPDKTIDANVVVQVDNSFDGFLRRDLKKVRAERQIVKDKMKITTDKDELKKLDSVQNALKVIANIPSGYNGSSFCRYGDIAVSLLTVGVGRILITDTLNHIREKYGDIAIELDTDGIYLSSYVDVDYLNNYLSAKVEELFGVKSELELELEEFNESFFTGMKQYILYDGEKLIVHGNAFMGSKLPHCFDIALEKLAHHVLKQEGEPKAIIKEVLNINQYEISDLILRTNLNKPVDHYSKTSLWGKLIAQKRIIGIEPESGSYIEYVKCKGGYQILETVNHIREIDKKYYENVLSKLIHRFNLSYELQTRNIQSLDKWV